MAVNQQDIIRQEPWFVTSLIRDWYFENYTKERSDALDLQLQQHGSNANWEQFVNDPKTLPVYTKNQLSKLLGDAGLNLLHAENRVALFSYLNHYPRHALQKLDLAKILRDKLNMGAAKDKLSYAFIDEYAKDLFHWAPKFLDAVDYEDVLVWASSSESVSTELQNSDDLPEKATQYTFARGDKLPDQRACFTIAEYLWDYVNPETQWWAIFDFIPFVKKIIEERKALLIAQSPFYRAKFEGKSVIQIHEENASYLQSFLSEDNPQSNACLQRFITSDDLKDDTQSSATGLTTDDFSSSEEPEEPQPQPKSFPKAKPLYNILRAEKVSVPKLFSVNTVDFPAPPVHQVVIKDIELPSAPVLQFPREFYAWDPAKSLSQHVRDTSVARNNDAKKQFDRDVHMMQETLKNPGSNEYHGSKSALVLKKLLYTLSRADCMYKRGDQWHRFSEQRDIPLASLLSHTTRILLQLPPKSSNGKDAAEDFFKKFLVMHPYHRHAATHGIIVKPNAEELPDDIKKHVVEIKPGYVALLQKAATAYVTGNELEGHYGINLAYGGDGNEHFLSQAVINNKGENGHLYLYYLPATETSPGAILFGIEQSAPVDTADPEVVKCLGTAVYDNLGGAHDMLGTPNYYSVSGGDHFGKAASEQKKNPDYIGLSEVGPDEYYDSMFCNLSHEQLDMITREFDADSFDESCLALPPQGDLFAVGHGKMNRHYESMVKRKMQDSQTSYLLRWREYLGYQQSEVDSPDLENSFILMADAIDEEQRHKIETVRVAIACLEEYPKRGDNYKFLQELVASLYEISKFNRWDELEDVVRRIESVHLNDVPIIDDLDERLLPKIIDIPGGNNTDDPLLQTLLTYRQQVQALVSNVVRTKDVLINAHHELMKLLPAELKMDPRLIENRSHSH